MEVKLITADKINFANQLKAYIDEGWVYNGYFTASEINKRLIYSAVLTREGKKKKTATIALENVKSSDGWGELAHELKWETFKKEHPELEPEEELPDAFYDNVISKTFEYGDFANLELEVDEDFNIVGGKIITNEFSKK